jgi:hypothetical protein
MNRGRVWQRLRGALGRGATRLHEHNRGRPWSGPERLELAFFAFIGLALLGYTIYTAARFLLDAGSHAGLLAFGVFLACSVFSLVRDLGRKRLGLLSGILLGVWVLGLGLVLAVDLFGLVV